MERTIRLDDEGVFTLELLVDRQIADEAQRGVGGSKEDQMNASDVIRKLVAIRKALQEAATKGETA